MNLEEKADTDSENIPLEFPDGTTTQRADEGVFPDGTGTQRNDISPRFNRGRFPDGTSVERRSLDQTRE